MAELHPLVLLAQRLAEGRRQHSSNAAFGQWVKENGFDRLTHRDRAALIRIAQLDPQEASDHISRSSHTTPELLWYRVLSRLAVRKTALVPVRKTEPEPEVEGEYAKKVEEYLERLRLRSSAGLLWLMGYRSDLEDCDPEVFYDSFDVHVIALAALLEDTSADPLGLFKHWLEDQKLFGLDNDDRDFLLGLIEDRGAWEKVIKRKLPR
jgi:hypothetical protein